MDTPIFAPLSRNILRLAYTITSPSPNEVTLKAYNKEIVRYIDQTPQSHGPEHEPLLTWINHMLGELPSSARILEIGSGTGRDASYIQEKGFNIICSDGANAFVDYLSLKGFPVIPLDILKDDIPGSFDAIFANAVFPHLTTKDIKLALKKTHSALPTGGTLAFNVKQGKGEVWIYEKLKRRRYTHLWNPQDLYRLVESCGFTIYYSKSDIQGDLPTHTWTQISARKT